MKKTLLLLSSIIFLFSTESNAQAFQWAKQFVARHSNGTNVVIDNNLNVISAGYFMDSVDLDPGSGVHWGYDFANNSGSNSYLSKLDANGNFVWGHTYNSSLWNIINSIDVDNQDNIIVMGQFRDSIDLDFGAGTFWIHDPNNNNSYYENIFIAKYDPAGNFIWGKGLHSTSPINNNGLWGHGLKVDAGNNVILSGHFRDTVDFDPGSAQYKLYSTPWINNSYYGDKFLLKLDVNGNFTWALQWHSSGNNNNNNGWWGNHELDVDANDNIFFPITFRDSMDIDPSPTLDLIYTTTGPNSNQHDVSLLKISPSGVLIWHKEIGGPGQEYCHSLATDPAGNIFYSIQTNSNPIDMDPGPGVSHISWTSSQWGKVILKLDNNGNFIWALKNIDNNWNNSWYGEGIATDTAGGLYLTTRIWQNNLNNNNQWDLDPGAGAYIVSSSGGYDVAFQNLDNNGQFVWGGVIGGSGNDGNKGMCTDNQRGVYLKGYFNQTADFDPTPDTSFMTSTSTTYDAYLVKLNNCNKSTSQIIQHCDSVVFNNVTFFHDTIYQFHYNASNGCDSAHSIVIDVKKLADDTLIVDTCKFYVWNNTTYTSSGFYTHNYGIPNGCDSIITLDLTINQGSLQSVNITGCDSAAYLGVMYYTPGSYLLQHNSMQGCDSNTVVNFTKVPIDTSLSYNGAATLSANAASAAYQWIDCNTMQPIVGQTSAFFTATQSGNYACIVTQNGCADTSNCYNITLEPNAVKNITLGARLYPNPSAGSYQLELDKNYKDVTLEIRTISGQLIWTKNFAQLKQTTLNVDQTSGVYMLYIKQGEQMQVKKLLKW